MPSYAFNSGQAIQSGRYFVLGVGTTANESQAQQLMPGPTNLTSMHIKLTAAQPAGDNGWKVTPRVNGKDSDFSFSVTNGAQSAVAHGHAAFPPEALVCYKITAIGNPTPALAALTCVTSN